MSTTATATQTQTTSVPTTLKLHSQEEGKQEEYRYSHLLPYWSLDTQPPLTPFEHVDPASRAVNLPNPRAFLDTATSVVELTPHVGTEITGVNLAQLDSGARDQVALEAARRGFLVFRDQKDFIDNEPQAYLDWGRHFGRLHAHPTGPHPVGFPELLLIYSEPNFDYKYKRDDYATSTFWHSDLSYEFQPPGLTTLLLVDQPKTGGDTAFFSQVAALKRLSPQFVAFLRTLKAVHSAVDQADSSRKGGGVVRREPVENIHPVVRKHPATGEEALYVNRGFTRRLVGLKKEESDAILDFLFTFIDRSTDSQARVKWRPYTVVMWDNRVTAHSAIFDFVEKGGRRHGVRITPQAERPIAAAADLVL